MNFICASPVRIASIRHVTNLCRRSSLYSSILLSLTLFHTDAAYHQKQLRGKGKGRSVGLLKKYVVVLQPFAVQVLSPLKYGHSAQWFGHSFSGFSKALFLLCFILFSFLSHRCVLILISWELVCRQKSLSQSPNLKQK